MRILSISLDKNIAIKDSPAFKRMLTYASLVDEMHIICLTIGESAKEFQDGNLFIYPTNSKRLINFILDAYRIGKNIIRKNGLTQHESIITTQDPFETGLIGYLLKKNYGLKLNIQDHNNPFESNYWKKESALNFIRYFLGKFIVKRSNSVRTVSLREKEYLIRSLGYDPKKIINFPIFTDWIKIAETEPEFYIKQKYPGFDFHILTLCRLEKVKNIPLLLEVFSEIIKEFPRTLLTIVGRGSQKDTIAVMIKRKNLQKNVIMEEWTNDPTSYYKTTDLFALTSFSEGWGLTIIEAAASKCPIVMTNTGCANEFIFNEKNGWIVKIDSKQDLIKALRDALLNSEKRNAFSQEAFSNLCVLPDKQQTLLKLKKSWEITLQN
jgi:glycosyltransferase involved in cell wall biosynthesis